MYFEMNIPEKAPDYMTPSMRSRWSAMYKTLSNRMSKLEQAKDLCGIPPEQFAIGAKMLFDKVDANGVSTLDKMSVSEIAQMVNILASDVAYTERIEWPNAETVVDIDFVSTSDWELIRSIGLGGSEASIIMGFSPYATPMSLYALKRGMQPLIQESDSGKAGIFDYGHTVEPYVVREFCRRSGAQVIHESRMLRNKKHPFLIADIDAIVRFSDGRIATLEAKTTTSFKRGAWAGDSVPPYYTTQCRHYMGVLDDERINETYICAAWGNTSADYVVQLVERKPLLEQAQITRCEEFWTEQVVAMIPPEASGNAELDLEDTRRLFIGYAEKGTSAELDKLNSAEIESLQAAAKRYLAAVEEKKQLEKKLNDVKAEIVSATKPLVEAMGRACTGTLPVPDNEETEYVLTFAPRSRTSVDTERLRLEFPAAYQTVVSVVAESSRPFSLKEKKRKKVKKA